MFADVSIMNESFLSCDENQSFLYLGDKIPGKNYSSLAGLFAWVLCDKEIVYTGVFAGILNDKTKINLS